MLRQHAKQGCLDEHNPRERACGNEHEGVTGTFEDIRSDDDCKRKDGQHAHEESPVSPEAAQPPDGQLARRQLPQRPAQQNRQEREGHEKVDERQDDVRDKPTKNKPIAFSRNARDQRA